MADFDDIIADLHAEDDVDRYIAACEEIDRVAGPRDLPRLHHLLSHGCDFTIREAVAVPVARLEGVAALRALLHAMHLGDAEGHDNDGLVTTIIGVVETDPAGAAPMLKELLESPSDDDRDDAAWLWAFAESAVDPESLFAAAKDSSPRVRASALGSLCSFQGREDVFQLLLAGLADAEPPVRVSAVSALGNFGDARALAHVKALHSDPDANVRRFVDSACAQLAEATIATEAR